jgi:hypothetical protein
MTRFMTALAGIAFLAAAPAANAVVLPKSGPFTFTGTVASATAACPYAAKAPLAGYTAILGVIPSGGPGGNSYYFKKGLVLVVSPTAGASGLVTTTPPTKTVFDLSNVFLPPGLATATGSAKQLTIPAADTYAGNYKVTIRFLTEKSFTAAVTLVIKEATGVCKTTYDLAFQRGLPGNLSNLL